MTGYSGTEEGATRKRISGDILAVAQEPGEVGWRARFLLLSFFRLASNVASRGLLR